MNEKLNQEWISAAINGDSQALEHILVEVKDFIFNLSLRMLGVVPDAEDATQDILIKVMTNLSSFRQESAFTTWVYRIAVNYLTDYKKSMFVNRPLNFEFYANDIQNGFIQDDDALLMGADREVLAEELKLSCSNVMLQCFDPQTRCIYILGTMFRVKSDIAADMLHISAESYRQRLSRARRKMADFLSVNCGICGGACNCNRRVGYAIQTHRLDPSHLSFKNLDLLEKPILEDYIETMETIDEQMDIFASCNHYQSKIDVKTFIQELIHSDAMTKIKGYEVKS